MRALVFAFAAAALTACATADSTNTQGGSGQAPATPVATVAAPSVIQMTLEGPQRFVLDPAHTQVAFSNDRFGYNHVLGRFETISGEVTLDQAHPENSSVTAIVQIASVASGNATRDEHLRGERWLNAAAFPTMEFRSTSVRRTSENTAEVTGDLTLRGQTHPLTLNVMLNRLGTAPSNQRPAAGFSATGRLSRTAFGVGAGVPTTLIGDDVVITIEALGQPPAP